MPNNKTLSFQKQYTINNTTRKVYYTKQYKKLPRLKRMREKQQLQSNNQLHKPIKKKHGTKIRRSQRKRNLQKKKYSGNSLRKPHKKRTIHPNKRLRITKRQNRTNTTNNSNKPQKNIPQNNTKIKKKHTCSIYTTTIACNEIKYINTK